MKNKKRISFSNIAHTLVTVVSLILIFIVILFLNKPKQVEVTVGEAAPETVYAPRSFVDETATQKKREEARNQEPNRYKADEEITKNSTDSITNLFALAKTYRSDTQNIFVGVDKLKSGTTLKISEETALALMMASDSQFEEMNKICGIVETEMRKIVSDTNESQKACDTEVDKLKISSGQKSAAKSIISLVLQTNQILDEEETEKARSEAEAQVEEVTYKKNQTIVTKGSIVTEEQYDTLMQLGLIKGMNQVSWTYTLGLILLMLICYIIISFFYFRLEKKSPASIPITALFALIVILICVYGSNIIPENMTELIPVGMFVGIVTIFSCARSAIITNIMLAVFCGVAFNGNWGYALCIIIAGTMSSYCFAAVKRRSHLLPASVLSSVFYGLTFASHSLVESANIVNALFSFVKGFGGGFISGLITIGSLPLIEWLFNATTPMKLSELANPENKLLKKLLVEAPGTYHHSLTVANISEIAARSIGADALLTRVGAYYHDIGKLRHPLYFKENQYDKNAHDSLEPEESSQIIISHVTEGVETAIKNRLPQSIIDIIAQHHGTTTTGYFLIRAKELDPEVDEAKFTYPGPAPKSKEAAIVMLADSCEAAVRSIDDKTEGKIEGMVRKIATERVNSGQFSHCNMTFEELETVIKVITKTLGGYFHERIKYE